MYGVPAAEAFGAREHVCSTQSVERLAVANEVADMVMRPGCERDFYKSRVMIRQRIYRTTLVTGWSCYWSVDL